MSPNLLIDLPYELLYNIITLSSSKKKVNRDVICSLLCVCKKLQRNILSLLKDGKLKNCFMKNNQKKTELYTQTINIYLEIPIEYIEYNILSDIIIDHINKNKYCKFNPFTVILKKYKFVNNSIDYSKKIRYVYDIMTDLYEKEKNYKKILDVYSKENSKEFLILMSNYKFIDDVEMLIIFDYYISNYFSKYNDLKLYHINSRYKNDWNEVFRILPYLIVLLRGKFELIITGTTKTILLDFLDSVKENNDYNGYICRKNLFYQKKLIEINPSHIKLFSLNTQIMIINRNPVKYLKYCNYFDKKKILDIYPQYISTLCSSNQCSIALTNINKFFYYCDLDIQGYLLAIQTGF